MVELKPYPVYKDSGIKWIEDVPNDWKLIKLRYLVHIRNNSRNREKLPYLGLENIESKTGRVISINEELVEGQSIRFKNNDVLFGKLRPYLAKVAHVDFEGHCSTEFIVLKAEKVKAELLKYIMLSSKFISYVDSSTYGTKMPRASWEFIKNIIIPLSISEQQEKIVKFLDDRTYQINSLISDKKRLIELLEEKRQAIITETVTKGLDPNVKMKDSGIEWIGEIPEHWETVKLKFIGDATMGLLYSPTETTYKEQGKLVLRASNIQSSTIDIQREDNVYVNKEIPENLITKVDDILICARSGSKDLIGKSALIDEHSAGHSFGAFTTVFRSEYNHFISYVFRSGLFQSQIGTYLTSTINQLTMSNLRNLEIVFPSKEEQKILIGFLREYDKNVNDSINIIKKQIIKLKEYRESLIYEAVTGKIDLRDYETESSDEIAYEKVAEVTESYKNND